jgi:vancomycin resistance protein YoaR
MRTLLFTSLVALGLVGACDRKKTTDDKVVPAETAPKPIESIETPSTTPAVATPTTTTTTTPATLDLESERAALSRTIEERTAALDAKINELEKRGDAQSKDAVATLRAKRDQARAKLSELGTRTQENWTAFKKDVSDTWDQLDRDVTEATR